MTPANPEPPQRARPVLRQVAWASVPVWSIGFLSFVPFLAYAVMNRRKRDWAVFAAYLAATIAMIIALGTVGSGSNAGGAVGGFIIALAGCAAVHTAVLFRPGRGAGGAGAGRSGRPGDAGAGRSGGAGAGRGRRPGAAEPGGAQPGDGRRGEEPDRTPEGRAPSRHVEPVPGPRTQDRPARPAPRLRRRRPRRRQSRARPGAGRAAGTGTLGSDGRAGGARSARPVRQRRRAGRLHAAHPGPGGRAPRPDALHLTARAPEWACATC